MGYRRPSRRAERGAAAVEFALVVPLLLVLLFGMIDYGVVFADSVSTRNGVREGARQGVVSNFGGGNSLSHLRTQTKSHIGAISGTTAVKIYAPQGWQKGKPLVVCAIVQNPGVIKFVPLPGRVRSRVQMSIEKESSPPTGGLSVADAGDFTSQDDPNRPGQPWC